MPPTMAPETIPFRDFDERGDVRIYSNGTLPHWRQADCTYFVTFRLADSLPVGVRREFEQDRNRWLLQRGIGIPGSDLEKPVNWVTVLKRLSQCDQRILVRTMADKLNRYLDAGYGTCLLKRREYAELVAESLSFFHGLRVLTGDFVVMPNHVHVLMRPLAGYELEDVLQSIKSFTASKINKRESCDGSLWMRGSYDHIVRDSEQLLAFQRYIHANPEKAGLSPRACVLRRAEYRFE